MSVEATPEMKAGSGIRVAICLNGFVQPAWVEVVLKAVGSIGGVEIIVVLNRCATTSTAATTAGRLLHNRHDLLWMAWSNLERRLRKGEADAFRPVDCESLLAGAAIVQIRTVQIGRVDGPAGDAISESDIDLIRKQKLDIIVDLGSTPLPPSVFGTARLGVWALQHGEHRTDNRDAGGVWEVLRGDAVTIGSLLAFTDRCKSGETLFCSAASTDRSSIRRNRNHCFWKAAEFIPRALRQLVETSEATKPTSAPWSRCKEVAKTSGTCGNIVALLGISRIIGKVVSNRICDRLSPAQWFIACNWQNESKIASSVTDVKSARWTPMPPPKDRYWADPFPVSVGDKTYLFFEEVLHATNRGRIVVSELVSEGTWSEPRVALERPYHLSYPFVFTWKNQWYMIPESLESRTIELWRCEEFPLRWTFDTAIATNVRAADTTLAEMDGRWWMFTCMATEGAGVYDELFVFRADNPRGPWTPHKCNPVVSDARHARPAGRVFQRDGKWLRPAQDCSGLYGRRIDVREIVRLTLDEYEEKSAYTIEPDWAPGLFATHTLNQSGSLTAIDGCRRRSRWK